MPYSNERAHRLGHVPTVNNEAVRKAFSRWEVVQAQPLAEQAILTQCVAVDSIEKTHDVSEVRHVLAVDGSDQEVEATRDYPSIKVGYLRVVGSYVDLDRLDHSGEGHFVDPSEFHRSHTKDTFEAALPGAGLILSGLSGVETWRQELDQFLKSTRFDEDSSATLADSLLSLYGAPGVPAKRAPLRRCPTCGAGDSVDPADLWVDKDGGKCPACGGRLFLADILRTHDEYSEEGSNLTGLTRVMLVAERLLTLGYMEHFVLNGPNVFRNTLFVTDGPLALFGVVAPLKRRFTAYHDALARWSQTQGVTAPLLVGVEKSGRFVEHAELIADLIPRKHVMMLTTAYVNRLAGRHEGNQYGRDEFYGRRFIYRTSSGDPLVITVPPKPGVLPYEGPGAESFDSYPMLRVVCEVLDSVRTRLYPNAVIPLALAHSAASLPLGVGHSVLRAMAQRGLGIAPNSQIRNRQLYS